LIGRKEKKYADATFSIAMLLMVSGYSQACYNHHLSDFAETAKKHHFQIELIKEFFNANDKNNLPRILSILPEKKKIKNYAIIIPST